MSSFLMLERPLSNGDGHGVAVASPGAANALHIAGLVGLHRTISQWQLFQF